MRYLAKSKLHAELSKGFQNKFRKCTFRHAQVGHNPGQNETGSYFPIETLRRFDVGRNVKRFAVPEILRRATPLQGKQDSIC